MNPAVVVGGLLLAGVAVAAIAGGKKKPSGVERPPAAGAVKRGPDGIGWIFGTPSHASFPFELNLIGVDDECTNVLVGEGFWPETTPIRADLAESLEGALTIKGNSVLGFVDYLLGEEGLTQPEEIAARILVEAAPSCGTVSASQWGPGVSAFYNWLLDRLVPYVAEWQGEE